MLGGEGPPWDARNAGWKARVGGKVGGRIRRQCGWDAGHGSLGPGPRDGARGAVRPVAAPGRGLCVGRAPPTGLRAARSTADENGPGSAAAAAAAGRGAAGGGVGSAAASAAESAAVRSG